MHGRERDGDIGAFAYELCRAVEVVGAGIDVLDIRRRKRDFIGMRCRGDGFRDCGIGGRDKLHAFRRAGGDAAAQVHLVAIIGRRIMRGGNHDASICLELAYRESGQRGGVLCGQNQGSAASCGDDLRRIALELRGAVAGIATNGHDWGIDLLLEPCDEPVGGADDHGAVHAGLTWAHGGAQARGAKGQGAGEGGGELSGIALLNPGVYPAGCIRIRVVLGPRTGVVIIYGGVRHGLELLEDLGGGGQAQAGRASLNHG